jgi:hypothetical protein
LAGARAIVFASDHRVGLSDGSETVNLPVPARVLQSLGMRLSLKLSLFTALGILLVLGCNGFYVSAVRSAGLPINNVETIGRSQTSCCWLRRPQWIGPARSARSNCFAT